MKSGDWVTSLERNPERAIPALEVPSLSELGLARGVHATARTRLIFALRPFLAVAALATIWMAGWWLLALALVPAVYGWSLTTIHHLIHGSLGFAPRTRSFLLSAVSLLLFESGHSLERTHLAHHGTDPEAEDPEGYIESLPWGRLLVEAPLFRYRLWAWARRQPTAAVPHLPVREHASIERRRLIEIGWHLAATALALWLGIGRLLGHDLNRAAALVVVYVAVQHVANAVFAVLAAKGPHTNWGRVTPTPLIAVRGRVLGVLLFGHIWHLEHHLYPEVPLSNLGVVAAEIEPLLTVNQALIVRTV